MGNGWGHRSVAAPSFCHSNARRKGAERGAKVGKAVGSVRGWGAAKHPRGSLSCVLLHWASLGVGANCLGGGKEETEGGEGQHEGMEGQTEGRQEGMEGQTGGDRRRDSRGDVGSAGTHPRPRSARHIPQRSARFYTAEPATLREGRVRNEKTPRLLKTTEDGSLLWDKGKRKRGADSRGLKANARGCGIEV